MAVRALARPPRSAPGPLLPEHDKYVGGPVGVGTLGGWQSHCFRFAFSGTRIEYIIRALPFVGTRRVPHPLVFKGAVFDFSAVCFFLLCAILCCAFTDAETFILSPSVAIGAGRILERRARGTVL